MPVLAAMPVIDPVAIADVEALLAAVLPNRVLHEPREVGGEGAIEHTGVDFSGNAGNDIGAAAWPVAARAVRMGCLEPAQDPGPVQKIVDQGIDGDQLHADFEPLGADSSGADQNAGQRHCQDLVRNAVDIAQRLDQGSARLCQRVWRRQIIRLVQPVIDPANQIALGNVANEQVQAIGKLVEVAVSQPMGRKRAGGDVVRLGAGAAGLLIVAGVKSPIGFQLRAGGPLGKIPAD